MVMLGFNLYDELGASQLDLFNEKLLFGAVDTMTVSTS